MQVIPTQPVPNQRLDVILNGQPCTIVIIQRTTGMFVDLYVNSTLIIGGVIAENANVIVRSLYLGFVGDICFLDTQGEDDPVFTGLGDRFFLAYFTPDELPLGVN